MKLKRITIDIIPHNMQDYDTVGNYKIYEDIIAITVSDMGNWMFNVLVAFHELIEVILIIKAGIKNSDITAFDAKFEADRIKGLHGPTEEPGNDLKAPYRSQHVFATMIERLLAKAFKVKWEKYDKAVWSFEYKKDKGSYGGI